MTIRSWFSSNYLSPAEQMKNTPEIHLLRFSNYVILRFFQSNFQHFSFLHKLDELYTVFGMTSQFLRFFSLLGTCWLRSNPDFSGGFLRIDPTVGRFGLDSPCPRLCRKDEKLLLLSRYVQVWTRQRIVHDLQSSLFRCEIFLRSSQSKSTFNEFLASHTWILKQKVEMKFSKNDSTT